MKLTKKTDNQIKAQYIKFFGIKKNKRMVNKWES